MQVERMSYVGDWSPFSYYKEGHVIKWSTNRLFMLLAANHPEQPNVLEDNLNGFTLGGITITAITSADGHDTSLPVDTDSSTYWAANANQAIDDWFEIDLGGDWWTSEVHLDNTGLASGHYPFHYKVSVKASGDNDFTDILTGQVGAEVTKVVFNTPLLIQWIKLTITTDHAAVWQVQNVVVKGYSYPDSDSNYVEITHTGP